LLIDASYDALAGLRSVGKTISDIDEIYLSHLHPDHFMALPQFALENYYVIKKSETIPVYCPSDSVDLISRACALFFNEEVTEHLGELFDFIELGPGKTVTTDAGRLQTYEADHTGNARMQKITLDEVTLGYTGDTGFLPDVFTKLLQADFTITEASSGKNYIPHHTTLQQLIDHPIDDTKRVYVSHVGETTLQMREEIKPPLFLAEDGLTIHF
jgi:ribonuclease BN (tRNA processing enzyme)